MLVVFILVGFLCFVVCGGALLALTILTRKRERLLVLEDAAYEAAKKVEAELAEGEEQTETKNETKTDTQKMLDSVKGLWNKFIQLFSKKEAEENQPEEELNKEESEEEESQEENDNGDEN